MRSCGEALAHRKKSLAEGAQKTRSRSKWVAH
jgi:hypothetical protein